MAPAPRADGTNGGYALRQDRRLLDVVELWGFAGEIRIAFITNLSLTRPFSTGPAIAVTRVQLVYHFHTLNHFSKWCESIAVEHPVVFVIDEDLRGPGVRPCLGERHHATRVALLDGVVRNRIVAPHSRYLGIAIQA